MILAIKENKIRWECLLKYIQGYAVACLLMLTFLELINVSDGGVRWFLSSPSYICSELLKAIFFIFLLYFSETSCKKAQKKVPFDYFLYGFCFGISTPVFLIVAGEVNQITLNVKTFTSIAAVSAWISFSVKQFVSWLMQSIISIMVLWAIRRVRSIV